jgi:hypothetical protein
MDGAGTLRLQQVRKHPAPNAALRRGVRCCADVCPLGAHAVLPCAPDRMLIAVAHGGGIDIIARLLVASSGRCQTWRR